MKNSTKLIAIALVAVAAIFGAVQPAAAQVSGTTTVTVGLNPLVILYYYSSASVTLSAANMATLTGITPANQSVAAPVGSPTVTVAAGSINAAFDGTVGTTPAPLVSLANLPLTLTDAYAIRAVAASLAVSITGTDLTNGTATIPVLTRSVSNATPTPLGLGTPIRGNVTLNLNLGSATTTSGNYTGTYTITVTAT